MGTIYDDHYHYHYTMTMIIVIIIIIIRSLRGSHVVLTRCFGSKQRLTARL